MHNGSSIGFFLMVSNGEISSGISKSIKKEVFCDLKLCPILRLAVLTVPCAPNGIDSYAGSADVVKRYLMPARRALVGGRAEGALAALPGVGRAA